jgi:hypothetical protein
LAVYFVIDGNRSIVFLTPHATTARHLCATEIIGAHPVIDFPGQQPDIIYPRRPWRSEHPQARAHGYWSATARQPVKAIPGNDIIIHP